MANKKLKTYPFDAAKYLDDEETIQYFIEEALETNDPAFIAHALGVVARARGMSKVAKKSGLSRESLYKALSMDGNPKFATIIQVMTALGVRFTVTSPARS